MIKEKKYIISGAGGLLGSHLVKALLQAGSKVIAMDLNLLTLSEKLKILEIDVGNENLELVELDLNNEVMVKAFFDNRTGFDGAVNCAYPRNNSYGRHFFDVSLASFNENVSLHLGTSFLFSQQCAAYFLKHKTPFSLVNISSVYGVIAPRFDIYKNTKMTMPVEYAAIKSAILHLDKYIASYIKDSRFRINSVSPGGLFDSQPEAFLNAYQEKTQGTGMLTANDIVGGVIFLLSEQSKYICAQNIIIDDGFCL